MFDKIKSMKSKIYLLLSAFFISGCANSEPDNMPLEQEYCHLIKETINLDRLQQYYHIDAFPGRIPLIVAIEREDVNCRNLVKFGQPVTVVNRISESSLGDEGYLELTKIDIINNAALVNFKYSPEGISGNIKFKKLNSIWMISDSSIVEL